MMLSLTDSDLRDLAGDRAFERGADYARRGRVKLEESGALILCAVVVGSERYRAEIKRSGDELAWRCECPAADDGSFCKHLVALALTARGSSAPSGPGEPESGLRDFLRAQPAERLADWLAELADADDSIAKRLTLRQSESDPRTLKKALGAVLRGRGFLDWRASTRFARDLDPALESLAVACAASPAHGRELCEFALAKLFARYASADDSSGAIGGRLDTLAELYRRTLAQQSAPDDPAHGRRFLKLQQRDDWNVLDLELFWPLLGARAQEAYAAAVEAEYASLGKPSKERESGRWSREFPVVHRMEALAAARGDVDLLIRVVGRDLSSGHAYERIVLVCREAGRGRDATSWAERGYRHHPEWRGMRALLADQYRRDGLGDQALELTWEDFRAHPTPHSWHRLKTDAAAQWSRYRERALAHVEQAEKIPRDGRRDVSARVGLLLADSDTDGARQLAEQHSVNVNLLPTLADAVAQTHPASAAAFIRRYVDATLPRLDASRYAGAVEQIARARRLQPGADTDAWIDELRARYRARRKLMALLDEL